VQQQPGGVQEKLELAVQKIAKRGYSMINRLEFVEKEHMGFNNKPGKRK